MNISTPGHKTYSVIIKFFLGGSGFRSYSLWSSRGKKWEGDWVGFFKNQCPLWGDQHRILFWDMKTRVPVESYRAIERKILPFSIFQKFSVHFKDLTHSLTSQINFQVSGCSILNKFPISCGIHKTHCCVQKTQPNIINNIITYKNVCLYSIIP